MVLDIKVWHDWGKEFVLRNLNLTIWRFDDMPWLGKRNLSS